MHRTLLLAKSRNLRRISSIKVSPYLQISRCQYHSYPDPNEKPQISKFVSTAERKKKTGLDYAVNPKLFIGAVAAEGECTSSADINSPSFDILSTVLPNGITVVSQDTSGLMTSFSFTVGTGSAFEKQDAGQLGCTNLIEISAFQHTHARPTGELAEEMELLGGMVQCISSKENLMYCVDVLRENVDKAVELLADTVLNAKFSKEAMEGAKEVMIIMQTEHPSDALSKDAVQRAAYARTGDGLKSVKDPQMLGNHHYPPDEKAIGAISVASVQQFSREQFYGENCVISAAGIDHEHFASLCRKYFVSTTATECSNADVDSESAVLVIESNPAEAARKRARVPPAFVGGLVTEQRELKEPFVKTCIGFEIGGWHDPMLIASCVLQQILGGGSSFSAGGPGKGMYTRLYKDVLNQHYWIESAQSYVLIQEQAGIIGIDGACAPEHVQHILRVMVEQLYVFAVEPVSDEELDRAKNMLKSMMMMQLESRLVLCEDIARQYITFGKRVDPAALCAKIDAVTAEDIMEVGKRILHANCTPGSLSAPGPAVSCVGENVSHMVDYDTIKTFSAGFRQELLRRKSSIFPFGLGLQ